MRYARDPTRPTKRRDVIRKLRKHARSIAKEYRDAEPSGERRIGEVTTKRQATAPRFRPSAELKRNIYKLACQIDREGTTVTLGQYVIRRDDRWQLVHRPKLDSVMDWTIRLVRGALLGNPPHAGIKNPEFLFDDTTMSRMTVELNYAFEHQVQHELLTAFIDELGGYEIIAARVLAGEYDFRHCDWISHYTHRLRFSHFSRTMLPAQTAEASWTD